MNGRHSGQQIVRDRRQAVDVGLLADQLAGQRFRCHVLERAHEEPGPGQPLLGTHFRIASDPEIQQLGALRGRVVHDVGGLEITVDDPGAMRDGERRPDLLDDRGHDRRGQIAGAA